MYEIIALNYSNLIILPKKIDFNIKIINTTSHVTVTQYYENQNDINIEAKYKFPMPAGSIVYSFHAKIGDKLIGEVIKEKSKAKKIYQDAYMLGNISPKTNVIIKINYICELKIESNAKKLRFILPLPMTSKYIQKGFEHIFVHGQIYMTDGIESINSIGYKINQLQKSERKIDFQISNLGTKDVIIIIEQK